MKEKEDIKRTILTFLRSRKNKKASAIEIRKRIFKPYHKDNPKDSDLIVQRAILDLERIGKVEIVTSNGDRYYTTANIEKKLKEKNTKRPRWMKGIDGLSVKYFYHTPFGCYIKLK